MVICSPFIIILVIIIKYYSNRNKVLSTQATLKDTVTHCGLHLCLCCVFVCVHVPLKQADTP